MSRVVLVTGASRGIGRASAQWFLDAGDAVATFSRSGDGPAGARNLRVDVADAAAVTAGVKEVAADLGVPEVVVVNAGVTADGLAVRMDDDQWHRVIATNLDGAFFCARAALSVMIRQRRGSLIFVGSVSPFLGVPGQANYAAAKAGIVGLARSLAKEVASRSITVNVVAPGFIDTDMTAALGDAAQAAIAAIPLGRVGDPGDVAGVIGFLGSPAARYVTGAVVAVDGGLAMGL